VSWQWALRREGLRRSASQTRVRSVSAGELAESNAVLERPAPWGLTRSRLQGPLLLRSRSGLKTGLQGARTATISRCRSRSVVGRRLAAPRHTGDLVRGLSRCGPDAHGDDGVVLSGRNATLQERKRDSSSRASFLPVPLRTLLSWWKDDVVTRQSSEHVARQSPRAGGGQSPDQ
jgi:hypothetical protein